MKLNPNGNGWFRVCLDGSVNTVHYTRNPRITNNGHLQFKDRNGKLRTYSAGHEWTVTETESIPQRLDE